jgi:hypothetical protein
MIIQKPRIKELYKNLVRDTVARILSNTGHEKCANMFTKSLNFSWQQSCFRLLVIIQLLLLSMALVPQNLTYRF